MIKVVSVATSTVIVTVAPARPTVVVSVTVASSATRLVLVRVTRDTGCGTALEQYARAGEYEDRIEAALTTAALSQSATGISGPCAVTRREKVFVKNTKRIAANMALNE